MKRRITHGIIVKDGDEMDKEIKYKFALIDAYMTKLFHSGLTKEQMDLVACVSKEIAHLSSMIEANDHISNKGVKGMKCIKIKNCKSCLFAKFEDGHLFCRNDHFGRESDNPNGIASFCELDDYIEPDKNSPTN